MPYLYLFMTVLRSWLMSAATLRLENLALRQQLAILKRRSKRPRLRDSDRLFWVLLSRFWLGWKSALLLVQPDTVVDWHREPPGGVGAGGASRVPAEGVRESLVRSQERIAIEGVLR